MAAHGKRDLPTAAAGSVLGMYHGARSDRSLALLLTGRSLYSRESPLPGGPPAIGHITEGVPSPYTIAVQLAITTSLYTLAVQLSNSQ